MGANEVPTTQKTNARSDKQTQMVGTVHQTSVGKYGEKSYS